MDVNSYTSATYIRFMNWRASRAQQLFLLSDIATGIDRDNTSSHTSKDVQQRLPTWQAKGLEFFQLPPYCSHRK